MIKVCLCVLLLLVANKPLAFDEPGHKIVAQVALTYLSDNSKAELQRLFGEVYRQVFIDAVGLPFKKEQSPVNQWMKNLHFVYFSKEKSEFEASEHCPSNQCSVGAVLEARKVLVSKKFSDKQKKQAIQYLIHYIADLHLPVNAGFKQDRSGQDIELQKDDSKVSLHWAWNKGLLLEKQQLWTVLASNYRQGITREDYKQWTQVISPQAWINESHQLAKTVVYELAKTQQYDKEFIKQATPVFDQQLKKAAVRLAWMLNDIYK